MQTLSKPAGLGIPTGRKNRSCPFWGGVKQTLIWAVLVGSFPMHKASVIAAVQDSSINSTAMRLVLQTSERRYRSGQPISITAYLENVSKNETYYVGTELGNLFSIESSHYIDLEIIDGRGRVVPIGRGAGTSIWKPGTTIAQKLAQQYVQLRPNMIFGLKNDTDLTLKPGQYRLKAIYHEVEASDWSPEERKALPVPVWTQTLVSNTVVLTINP